MARAAQLTPMLRHYLEVKREHPDAILLYRMGDFYEAFFEDAERAAPVLEIALTARHRGRESEAPMCGVPHHALELYLGKLIQAGFRVAICDQVEDPREAKGLVRREVTRVVTPGTLNEPELLPSDEENLLATLVWEEDGSGAGAFLDVSTGRFFARRWPGPGDAAEDLAVLRPREVLVPAGEELPAPVAEWLAGSEVCRTEVEESEWLDRKRAAETLERQFGVATLRGFGVQAGEAAVRAAALALRYAQGTQRNDLVHVRELTLRGAADAMVLDATTQANLELFRNLREGGRERTLLAVLDRTVSPGGGRLLRDWLRRPLSEPAAIERRLEAVADLLEHEPRRSRLRDELRGAGDPERLVGRAAVGRLGPREAAALRDALVRVPTVQAELDGLRSPLLGELAAADPVADLAESLERRLHPTPAAQARDGEVIADGVCEELDGLRSLARDGKRHILDLETRERERTGIGSLKVRFNKVFGYYLEVTKANQDRVPEEYERKQTLVNAERYVTPELKELEERILTAEERRVSREEELFAEVRGSIAAQAERLLALARALAAVDVLAAFAEAAGRYRYCRPVIEPAGDPIHVEAGRHPVVERLHSEPFVPNDVALDAENGPIVVLTGPNMGGKSTYLRQVALISLMAQAGSFVPADAARLGVVDRIFTRVGASDDLTRGESTFMVEMVETANILRQATPESLVILDEVGRGTATFDGLSLAWAIVEHLHQGACPKTVFATHYHELTELSALLPGVVNRTLEVKEFNDEIIFLRRVVPGSADKSYGLQVARLAGIPEPVVRRAAEILANLEAQEYDLAGRPRLAKGSLPGSSTDQLQLFAPPEEVVAAILAEVDVERLAPLAALNLLHSLKSRLGGG